MTELSLLSPSVRANPYSYYAELRRDAPVHQASGIWLISRYEDVLHVLKHPEPFSSTAMRLMMTGGIGMMGTARDVGRSRLLQEADNLIASDPPVHTHLRNVVNRGFTPRRIAALEPRILAIAQEALDRAAPRGAMDLVADLSTPLPVRVIAEMLGVPTERFEDFKRWSDTIVTAITGVASQDDPEEAVQTREEFLEYIAGVVEERRQSPRDDLISTLVQAGEGERALTEGEVIAFTMLLLVAGNETTTNLIGNAVLALLAHPQELARVRANPGLVPALVEETLRYDSPVQGLFRQTTEDVELAGTSLPKGALLMLLFASANRDERQFPDPERFDVMRNPRGHLAFGFGIHFCLGAALARLEARIALESLLARCDEISRPDEPVEWIDSLLLRGPRSLPLRFRAA